MKPGDEITVTYPNGVSFTWEVLGVHLGGVDEESVIELIPCDTKLNSEGRTLCPAAILYALSEGGSILIREKSNG